MMRAMDSGVGRRATDVLLAVLAVAVIAFAGWLVQRNPTPVSQDVTTTPSTAPSASTVPSASATSDPPAQSDALNVLVLGDESVRGSKTAGRWIGQLGGTDGTEVNNRSRPLVGYVADATPQECGLPSCPNLSKMLDLVTDQPTDPDVVLVSAGSHDGGVERPALTRAVSTFLDTVRATYPTSTVVVLSPVVREPPAPVMLDTVTEVVEAAATGAGVVYLDVGQPYLDAEGDDKARVKQAGEVLGAAVTEALADLPG